MLAIATGERGNSCRKTRLVRPLNRLTISATRKRRVGFNKQVNVIRHDLDGMTRHAVFGGDRGEQRLEPRINRMRQDKRGYFGHHTM